MPDIRHWVFDLDDTLYAEREYVRSALTYCGAWVAQRFGQHQFSDLVLSLSAQEVPDPIGKAWLRCALPEIEMPSMITAMRAHVPKISLSAGAKDVLAHLRQAVRPYAIVTDGRRVTQRAKIDALGCADAKFVSISEEVGFSKLDLARFVAVAAAFPAGRFCYVGDNPAKDFFAPRWLGWETIMLDHHGEGVHPQHLPNDIAYHPDRIVKDLREILPQL